MIYTLEKPYTLGLYLQWTRMLQETGIRYKSIMISDEESTSDWNSFLSFKSNRDYVNSYLSEEDTLMIDSHFLEPFHGDEVMERFKTISREFNCKQIIVFFHDNAFSSIHVDGYNGDEKIKIFSPVYSRDWDDERIKNHYNFYLCNAAYQSEKWLSSYVYNQYKDCFKYKKFLSNNGVFKFHRSFIYDVLKKNDLLKDTFYSYTAYDVVGRDANDDRILQPKSSGYTKHIGDFNVSNRYTRDEIQKVYSKQTHKEVTLDLPIILDYSPHVGMVRQYSFMLPYTCNSYVEIVGATIFDNRGDDLYMSEKIFKPFMSHLLPIYVAQSGTVKFLRRLGFRMYDRFIDHSYDEIENDLDRLVAVGKEIERIGKMSIEEIHHTISELHDDRNHNSRLLEELYHTQKENLINVINGN